MEKKHYITISICALLCVIGFACFGAYYRDYIKPKSYSIGIIEELGYKKLAIKDYLSDDEVIFSQNINDGAFKNENGIAIYEYNFDPKEFNGEEKDYMIYVNDYMVNNITETAGTVGGEYVINYYDVNKSVLCSSTISIDFSFYALQSKLKVSLNNADIGYLMNYFKIDNFVITLAESPFTMMNKDVEVGGSPTDELTDIVVTIKSDVNVEINYHNELLTYETDGYVHTTPQVLGTIDAKAKDSLILEFLNVNTNLSIQTDGTYTIDTSSNLRTIVWEDASYLTITITKSTSSGENYT